MALPTITAPHYTLTLPFSKKEVVYRPFLIKEEKILLLAAATKSDNAIDEIYQALVDVLRLCTMDKLRIDTLCSADFEYLFLKVKGASKGGVTEQRYKCTNLIPSELLNTDNLTAVQCGSEILVNINFDEIKLSKEFPENVLKVTSELSFAMKPPSAKAMMLIAKDKKPDEMALLSNVIDMIIFKDETYSDYTQDELVEFLEQLSEHQIKPLVDYFKDLPRLEFKETITCGKCKHKHEVNILGLENFFG